MRVLLKLLCFLVVFSCSYFVIPVLQTALAQEALQELPPDFVGDIQDSTADTGTGSGSLP